MVGGLGRGGIGNKSIPISAGAYKMTPEGYFGSRGYSQSSSIRHLPGGKEEAKKFFDDITAGFIEERWAGKTLIREMPDGTYITYRVTSSSDGIPAIDIRGGKMYKEQKIHFMR